MTETNLTLKERMEACGFDPSPEVLDAFAKYKELVREWNEKIDITAITDDREIDEKHFIDSLSLFRHIQVPSNSSVIDIGTGGGFPGVPMKLWDPSIRLTLLDSLNKRIVFLNEVIRELNLDHTRAIHARAEELARKEGYRDSFDICVSRAVAPFATLLEYCLPYVRVGGFFYAMKGPEAEEEIKNGKPALDALGGKVVTIDSFVWTQSEYRRTIVVVEKVRPTPKKYPRGQGKPRKAPLSL